MFRKVFRKFSKENVTQEVIFWQFWGNLQVILTDKVSRITVGITFLT